MRSQKLSEAREKVLRALSELKEELCAKVYLFGSYAQGTHTLESDVDVIVVSDKFRGLKYPERAASVRIKLPTEIGFDIIPLTPEEFEERKGRVFFKEISKHWIEIK